MLCRKGPFGPFFYAPNKLNTTGSQNTAVGGGTTGSQNTAVGGGTTGSQNTAVGGGTTGSQNTTVGGGTTGSQNTAVGGGTTGSQNTAVGGYCSPFFLCVFKYWWYTLETWIKNSIRPSEYLLYK